MLFIQTPYKRKYPPRKARKVRELKGACAEGRVSQLTTEFEAAFTCFSSLSNRSIVF